MEAKTEPQPMTGLELNQAQIDAWTIVLRAGQSQVAIARRNLVALGVKLKPAEFVQILDETLPSVYNENVERANSKPVGS